MVVQEHQDKVYQAGRVAERLGTRLHLILVVHLHKVLQQVLQVMVILVAQVSLGIFHRMLQGAEAGQEDQVGPQFRVLGVAVE